MALLILTASLVLGGLLYASWRLVGALGAAAGRRLYRDIAGD